MSSLSSSPFLVASASLNFPSIASNGAADLTVTVNGAVAGDGVILGPPATLEAGLMVAYAAVTAANTVTIRLRNVSGGAVDAAAATWKVIVVKR